MVYHFLHWNEEKIVWIDWRIDVSKEMLFVIVMCIVCVIAIGLCLRLYQYRKQVRQFTKLTRRRSETNVSTPIKVDMFQADFVELANTLNAYTDKQKELEQELAKDRERLNYVIAGISHDFRTPLTAAIGYMQMVDKSGDLQEKSQEYLDVALERTRFLKELSDAFFELSALEANKEEVQLTTVNVQKLLQEVMLEQFEWISKGEYQTDFQIPEQDIFVLGNEQYLKRILDNLFSNLQKYAISDIRVSLSCNEGRAVLEVENDVQEWDVDCNRVFEPFYRGESRSKSGSGLGLYVVKCLAEKMDMQVVAKLDSQRFYVSITSAYS